MLLERRSEDCPPDACYIPCGQCSAMRPEAHRLSAYTRVSRYLVPECIDCTFARVSIVMWFLRRLMFARVHLR